MNPHYLWLADAVLLLTVFVLGPVIGIAIAYAEWKEKRKHLTTQLYVIGWLGSAVAFALLFGFAKWLDADVRTPQYFLQLASMLLGGLLLGVCMGCGFCVLLRGWRWHKKTRLRHDNSTER